MHVAAFDREILETKRGKSTGREFWAKDLHHLAYFHDDPSRGHLYGFNRPMGLDDQMGQWAEIIGAAAAVMAPEAGASPAGGTVPTGPTTGIPSPGASSTTVSPVLQTQISPQISPTFQQVQDSPGSVQAATATQYMPGGMFAEGGSGPAAPSLSPYGPSFPDFGANAPTKYGGLPVSPLDPVQFTDIRDFPDAGRMIRDIRESAPFNWTPVYVVGGVVVTGAIIYAIMRRRR